MRRCLVPLVCVLVLAAGCGGAPEQPPSGAAGKIKPGSVSAFRAALRSRSGKPVVVNYWATWCVPCRQEMPRIVDATRKYKGKVAFLGIDVQDDPDSADAFVERYRMPFTSLTDPNRAIVRSQRILGLPVTQFYDAEGKLAFNHQGEIEAGELREKIESVLEAG